MIFVARTIFVARRYSYAIRYFCYNEDCRNYYSRCRLLVDVNTEPKTNLLPSVNYEVRGAILAYINMRWYEVVNAKEIKIIGTERFTKFKNRYKTTTFMMKSMKLNIMPNFEIVNLKMNLWLTMTALAT